MFKTKNKESSFCKKYIIIFVIAIVLVSTIVLNTSVYANVKLDKGSGLDKLALQQFYIGNFYKNIFNSKDDESIVNPYVEPQMGWKTDGKPIANPTKVAADGLAFILANNVSAADKHAQWLLKHSKQIDGAIFFPFNFDFAPYYPYSLKAPWNSALTQGLSLGLFSYLYEKTNEKKYKDVADRIYRSYTVPIEKGGFTRFEKEGPFFEEYPTKIPTRVLNGAAVSMLALYDYSVIMNNHEAEVLFQKSVARFEPLLKEYEVTLPYFGSPISSYSLAPVRKEITGRFVGDGNAFIFNVKLIGKNKDNEKILSEVKVGSKNDDDVNNNFYIWADPIYMNWGSPTSLQSISGRMVNGIKGKYNHSPFKFVYLNDFNKYNQLFIEVNYISRDNKNIDLQLYDENEYWLIGKLPSSLSMRKERFELKPEFIDSFLKRTASNPNSPIDVKYLDDNQILVDIIGKVANSKTFLYYAKRWEHSKKMVPARWLNRFPENLFENTTNEPVISLTSNSEESKHVEYPSIMRNGDIYFLYYSAYGDDNRWRIFLATSKDGHSWVKQGRLFDEKNLEFKGNYAFPFVIENPIKGDSEKKYLMYFSVAQNQGDQYNKLYIAYSPDGLKWRIGREILKDKILDPFITITENNLFEMYYCSNANDGSEIKKVVSNDGIRWGNPSVVIRKDSKLADGYYTIGGVRKDGKLILFIEGTNINQHYLDMYIVQGDKVTPYSNNPVYVDRDWEGRWDNIRYGLNIFRDNGKYFVYYNGISTLGAETGGQIGRAELKTPVIEKYLMESIE